MARDLAIVCLHGLGRGPADWAGVAAGLAEYGPVATPTLPRSGGLESVVEAAGRPAAPSVLIGHSLGGIAALRVAAAGPVAGVVLCDSFYPPSRNGRPLLTSLADYGSHRAAVTREMIRRGRPNQASGARALAELARLGLLSSAFHALADRMSAPTLVVHARDDHHVPVDFALAAARRHPAWQVRLLDDGGHNPHVSRPEQWLGAVSPWLARLG